MLPNNCAVQAKPLDLLALQAKDWHYGHSGLHNARMNYDKMHVYWATAAMRLSCALKTEKKELCMHLEPGELVCLAELLKQKSDLQSLVVYGIIFTQ